MLESAKELIEMLTYLPSEGICLNLNLLRSQALAFKDHLPNVRSIVASQLSKVAGVDRHLSPAYQPQRRSSNESFHLRLGLQILIWAEEEHADRRFLRVQLSMTLFIRPFLQDLPRNLSHHASTITCQAIVVAATSVVVAP